MAPVLNEGTFVRAFLILTGACTISALLDIKMTVRAGDKVALACRVPYNTKEDLVMWYMGTKRLSVGTTVIHYASRMMVVKPAPNEFNLVIKSVVRSDDEVFTCKSYKDVFSRIELEVQWRPEFEESSSSPYHVTMEDGRQGTLMCTAEGKPEPLITWYRRPQTNEAPFEEIGVTGHTLTLRQVTRYVNDVFMCNASNVQGSITREMNVSVNFKPEVDIFEGDVIYTQNGEQVLVTCLVQGSPLHDFYWTFKGQKLESTWKYMIHVEHQEGYPTYLLTLMLRPGTLGPDDFGTYTCHAESKTEEADDEIRILQEKKVQKHSMSKNSRHRPSYQTIGGA